jgi:hypothetical protein
MHFHIHKYHHWDEEAPPWVADLHDKLDLILEKQDQTMSTFDDLKGALDGIAGSVSTVKTDVDTLLQKLSQVPTAGMTPEQQAALDAAVQQAQSIKQSLGAIDAEVNPQAPAPTA